MKLHTDIRLQDSLKIEEKKQMLELMKRHYVNVKEVDFINDLTNKDYVILLYNLADELVGFSTFKSFEFNFQQAPIRIAFSGDTIIDKKYWGTIRLPLAFGQLMNMIKRQNPDQDLYWFLISKGIRTYRFLPVFFDEYYPSCDNHKAKHLKPLMDQLGTMLFNHSYDSEKGLVLASNKSQYLAAEFSSNNHQNRDTPHIDFFYSRNPGYYKGDELACILKYDEANLRPYIRKQLAQLESAVQEPLCL